MQQFLMIAINLALAALTRAEVPELTDRDFNARIAENKHTLVLFYAPWCKRSRRLLPEYAKAAEELRSHNPPIALTRVDCTEDNDEICEKFAQDTYPTLKIFDDGKFVADYDGPHISYGIVKYMKAQIKPASKQLFSMEELESYIRSSEETTVVGFFTNGSAVQRAFNAVANKLKVIIAFAQVKSNKDEVVLYRPPHLSNKFEDSSLTYRGAPTVTDLIRFIITNVHGLVGVRTLDNQSDFPNPLIVAYFAIDYQLNPKTTHYWRNRVLVVAKEFPKVNFAISPSDEFDSELRSVGVYFISTDKPIVVARGADNQKFLLQEEFSVEALRKFVADFLNSNVEPYIKSQQVPTTLIDPVVVAVAKNFDKVVVRNGKDTLIKFYAPWCGYCKELAPIYKKLAERLQDEEVAIVEMDAEANEVPAPYAVSGYPTIYWAPKGRKGEPVKYTGSQTVEVFIKFIAQEATEELKGWDREGNVRKHKIEL